MNDLKRNSLLLYLVLYTVGLAGCAQVEAAATDPAAARTLFLEAVGLVVFGLTLLYAGVRAFLAFNEVTDDNNAEGRIQLSGFVAGLLLGVLVMAVDSAPTPVPMSSLFATLPILVLIVAGLFGGLLIGILNAVIVVVRKVDSAGLVVLVLSFLSSTGIYLLLLTDTPPGLVLSGFISILVGLLIFRMLFPYSPADK